jgi:uncharacterized protein
VTLTLALLEGRFAVCRLAPGDEVPAWVSGGTFTSVTRTRDELSVVCAESAVPQRIRREDGWRVFKIEGPLDFGLTGILASVTAPLAAAGVSIFALSTFDTDYVMVKEEGVKRAVEALAAAGHRVST